MQKLSHETLQNFCRACLKELKQRQQFKIYNLNLQIRYWLEDVTLDNPLSQDIYSNSICQLCRNKLKEFLEFHLMCKESRRTVDKLLATKKNKFQNHPNKKTINAGNCEVDEDAFSFDYLTKTDYDSIVKSDEPLICKRILNVIETTNMSPNVNRNISHFVDEESDPGRQGDDTIVNSDNIYSDSECKILIEDQITNLKEKIKAKYSTKKDVNLSKSKTERKKYTYLFRCDRCKYRSVSQKYLDMHMRTHYGLKPYQCPHCDDSFNKSTMLLKHLNDIHGQKKLTIICEHEQCGKEFTSSRIYKDHYRQNHLPQQCKKKQDKSMLKSPHRHVCEECGKIYTKLQIFKEHQYTHQSKEIYPFQCDVCDKAFVKRRTYNEHKLRHAGIKNFECSHCKAKRTTRKELREHMNSHTRERQYPCPNCPMIFYRTSNRRVHIDVVHRGIRRFTCRFCNQTFGKGDNLKNHELLHTGEKPHVCSECGKRFVQKVSLRLHMKTHCK